MPVEASPHHPMPPWLPPEIAAIVPNYERTPELNRLVHNVRMRRVWQQIAKPEPLRTGVSPDRAMREVFALALDTAVRGLPVTLIRKQRALIEKAGGWDHGGWSRHFTSLASLDDSPVEVAHMPDDPVAKRMQLTLSAWFERTYGGPHLSLVQTITEVALDRPVLRMAGRLPSSRKRKPPGLEPIPAPGC